jgi:hypothetical protein
MTTLANGPRLMKGGIVLIDPESSAIKRVIVLQYNPDAVSRSFQVQTVGGDGDRVEPMRIKGPPIETLKVDAEIDATDQLEFPDQNAAAVANGIQPLLAALEMMIYPTSTQLIANNALARAGTLEIIPMQSPLALFIWSRNRILPVRITELSVAEEAFDNTLNPIRARVSLGMRVLSVDDLGFDHKGGSLFMAYHQQKERLARLLPSGALATFGIGGIP